MIALLTGLAGILFGAVLQHALTSHQARRRELDDLFNAAIVQVTQLQAARFIAAELPMGKLPFLTQEDVHVLEPELRQQSVREFIGRARDCRMALAATLPLCPEIAPYVDRFEISENEAEEVIRLLRRHRHRSVRQLTRGV